MIVYLITNKVNGRRYVGITTLTLEERWKKHVASSRCPKSRTYKQMSVVKAIAKHGPKNFKKKIIEKCSTADAMNEAEVRWIAELDTQDPSKGYNLTAGGKATMKGRKHTAATKALMRESQAKANADPETRKKKSAAAVIRMARPHCAAAIKAGNARFMANGMPEDVKQKLREAMSGERNANYGKPMPEERRAKLSAAHAGKVLSLEHKAAIAKGVAGKSSPRGLNRRPIHVYDGEQHVMSYLKLEFLAEDMRVSVKALRAWLRSGKKLDGRRYVRDESTISALRSKQR